MSDDLISRQAAIDALESKKDKNAKGEIGGFYNAIIQQDIETVMKLPSAQPEIIRCKDCRDFRRWVNTDITFCDKTEHDVTEDDFCSQAERRKDG